MNKCGIKVKNRQGKRILVGLTVNYSLSSSSNIFIIFIVGKTKAFSFAVKVNIDTVERKYGKRIATAFSSMIFSLSFISLIVKKPSIITSKENGKGLLSVEVILQPSAILKLCSSTIFICFKNCGLTLNSFVSFGISVFFSKSNFIIL